MPDEMRSGTGIGDSEQLYSLDGKRKAEMTAEERANYERERNRVHARNTRARKKQYMEELKERVESMHAQRAAAEQEKEAAAQQEQEKIARWCKTLTTALNLRCDGVTDEKAWKEVLSEDFRLVLPMTPYRPYDPADVEDGRRRVLLGVEGMIADTESLTEMCVNLAARCREKEGGGGSGKDDGGERKEKPRVRMSAFLGTGELLFSGDVGIMCIFCMRTVDAGMFGSPLEVEKNGMLRAVFDEEGKLEDLEMMFDGVAVHQQLLRVLESNPCEGQARPRSDGPEADNDPTSGKENASVAGDVEATSMP